MYGNSWRFSEARNRSQNPNATKLPGTKLPRVSFQLLLIKRDDSHNDKLVVAIFPLVFWCLRARVLLPAGGVSRILHQAEGARAAKDGVFLPTLQGEGPPKEPPAPIPGGGRAPCGSR